MSFNGIQSMSTSKNQKKKSFHNHEEKTNYKEQNMNLKQNHRISFDLKRTNKSKLTHPRIFWMKYYQYQVNNAQNSLRK